MQIFTKIIILLLLIQINYPTKAQNIANNTVKSSYNQQVNFLTTEQKTELNFLLPKSWSIKSRIETEEIRIEKDSQNYLIINLENYQPQRTSNICYKEIEYKELDSRITSIQSPKDSNRKEYIFKTNNITLNHIVTIDSIDSIEQESGYSYIILEGNEYKNLIPKEGDIYKLCYRINNQGINNVKNQNIYKIESKSNNQEDLITIENILTRSVIAKDFEPDPVNRNTALATIKESIKNEERSSLYVFVTLILFLFFFGIFLLYKNKKNK